MSFKPQGASIPARFKKSNSNTFFQWPKDRLCVVDGYDVSSGTMFATEIFSKRKIEVKINKDKTSSSTYPSSKWNGNSIDEKMSSNLSEGQRVILESCKTDKKLQRNGEEVSMMTCNWISGVPDQSPDKSFTTAYTVNAYNNRVVGVQVWQENGEYMTINPADPEGEERIDSLGEKMDKIVAEFKSGDRPVPYGVQFRTLVKSDSRKDKKGEPMYELVDMSPPFDWIRTEKDSEGNVIKEGHPLDREHLEGYLNGYLDYVYGTEEGSDIPEDEIEPGLVASGVISEGKDITVEVTVYRAFQAAPLSNSMELRNERTPLFRLSNVMTKYGQMDETGYVGKNWGVAGIVVLTADQSPKSRDDDWMPRNLVTRVFTNGYTNNIQSMIPAADGLRVFVNPSLDRVRDYDKTSKQGQEKSYSSSSPSSDHSEVGTTPALEPAQGAFDDTSFDDDDDDNNYFADSVAQVNDDTNTDANLESDDVDNKSDRVQSQKQDEPENTKPATTKSNKRSSARFRRST